MTTDKEAMVEIVRGANGDALYINNYRVAGVKPLGGGETVCAWRVKLSEFRSALGIPTPKENNQ